MTSVALEYRQCQITRPKDPPAGLDGVVDGFVGRFRRRHGLEAELRREAEAIDAKAEDWKFLSEAALRRHLAEFRDRFRRRSHDAEACLPDALAAIREAAERTTTLRPFTVQLMGALVLHRGCLAEMATGEGKTLTAALPAILAGWTGRPCHIVTVNDYLAQRDARRLQPLYAFCGVSVGCVTGVMPPEDRMRGYAQDVTYTTSKEVVADFLRDRLRLAERHHPARRLLHRHLDPHRAPDGLVMRGLHTAIIDEADSVLIDEAVTPLIISAAQDNAALQEMYAVVWKIADQLHAGTDYQVDLRYKEIALLPEGRKRIEESAQALPGRWRGASRPIELVEQALTAREFFKKGKQYVIDGGKVVIVDEFTGRMMPMRKWRHGLHQAIEAKEGLPVSSVDQTLARLSFQRYFRLYRKLSGMTGTAKEAAGELWHTYRLPVLQVPTNRPVIRRELPDRFYPDRESKLAAIVADVAECHRLGRPVLVGTRNVATSEELAERLRGMGFTLNLLNALNDGEEARIVAHAGQPGSITIATNMAGRGTDIMLGAGVAELGGLHVIASERHESHRIDRQLFGRAARQGDPGSAVAYVSADDELLARFSPRPLLDAFAWSARRQVSGHRALGRLVGAQVQRMAQMQAYASRRAVIKMDHWLEEAVSFSGTAAV
jgi:preprotein translocase subunit SecA